MRPIEKIRVRDFDYHTLPYAIGDRVIVHKDGSDIPATVVGINIVQTSNKRLCVYFDKGWRWKHSYYCGVSDVRPMPAVDQLARLV